MASAAICNDFTCSVSPNQPLDQKIEGCKLDILQFECEKRGVKVNSSTTTSNYMLTNDRINTRSTCRDLKFTVTSAEMNRLQDQIRVVYVMDGKPIAAERISYQQWTDLGTAQTKTSAQIDATKRQDSTMLVNVGANVQIDSREIKQKAHKFKEKALLALTILLSD